MTLPSHQLDAFLAVARTRNFSQAAKVLGVTQSALSQRVLNLEETLEAGLFVRAPKGVRLTELGEAFLTYSQCRERLEAEFLSRLKGPGPKELAGVVRVAGFSSVLRSLLMPALGSLIAENPNVQIELLSREIRELPGLLRSGEADFILTDRALERGGIASHLLGHEENVLVESKSRKLRSDVYLDHDAEDTTTEEFLRLNHMRTPQIRRSFLDDIYGILDGVALGWGRAVVPRHLAMRNPGVRVFTGLKPLRVPVMLCYYEQTYRPKLDGAVLEALVSRAHHFLKG